MTYRFEYDETSIGDMRFSRDVFVLVQDAHEVMLADLVEWNRIARAAGALTDLYPEEISLLEDATEWGRGQLKNPNARYITVSQMTVGGLRHDKAALEYAALKAQHAAQVRGKDMPSEVAHALGEKARRLNAEAAKIEQPAAAILEELRNHFDALLREQG